MKGHIRERSPGHWAIVIDVRDPEGGKRKQRWYSFKGAKRQAQIECARLISEIQKGTAVEPSRMTVAAFLERWIEHMQGQVSPRSHERYAELARKNLVPLLGALALTKLQPAHISQAYAKALASGRRDGAGGLSARTVTHMHRVLREALQQGVRWQLLARNPADAVKPPKVERQQMSVLDTDATVELIGAARGTPLFIPILLGVRCGLRRGEVVALRWRNVDLDRGQISVVASAEQTDQGVREKEPKNGKGRTIVLSATEVEELRTHRRRQAEALLASACGSRTITTSSPARMVSRYSPGHSPTLSSNSCGDMASKFGCTTCATATQPRCWRRACIPRSRKSGSAIRASASRSIFIHTCCQECRPKQ